MLMTLSEKSTVRAFPFFCQQYRKARFEQLHIFGLMDNCSIAKEHHLSNHLSYWEYEYLLQDVDYLIVGTGIVGLSTAIEILERRPDAKVLIIDKKTMPIGASTRNAGFACFGSVSEILSDIRAFGEESAIEMISMRYSGLEILKKRVHLSDMNFRPQPGIEIFDEGEADQYVSQIAYVNGVVGQATGIEDCFHTRVRGYGKEIFNPHEGSLHPQRMIAALELRARTLGVRFLTGVSVHKINDQEHTLETASGKIVYEKLIICTNGFTGDLLPELDLIPARNQVIVSEPIPGFALDGCYHMHQGYVYFREIGGRLLLGGGRHIDVDRETTSELNPNKKILDYLLDIAHHRILQGKKMKIDHTWSGILGVGSHKMPIVRYVKYDVIAAIRMGGMGVAVGSSIGRMVADLLLPRHDNTTAPSNVS